MKERPENGHIPGRFPSCNRAVANTIDLLRLLHNPLLLAEQKLSPSQGVY